VKTRCHEDLALCLGPIGGGRDTSYRARRADWAAKFRFSSLSPHVSAGDWGAEKWTRGCRASPTPEPHDNEKQIGNRVSSAATSRRLFERLTCMRSGMDGQTRERDSAGDRFSLVSCFCLTSCRHRGTLSQTISPNPTHIPTATPKHNNPTHPSGQETAPPFS